MTDHDPLASDSTPPSVNGEAAIARPGDASARRRKVWLRGAVAATALVLLLLLGRQLGGLVAEAARRVESLGTWAPMAFIVGYAVATVCFVPGLVLTLAAGALFGVVRGTAYVFAGALLGSSAAFVIARYLARGAIERRLAGNPRFAAIDRAIGREGRKIVFLLRLSPVFPFNLLNYALGLTRVRYVDALIASVGMLPGTLLYVYGGKVIGDVAAVAAGAKPPSGAGTWVVVALGLAATIAVTAVITGAARRALSEEVEHARP